MSEIARWERHVAGKSHKRTPDQPCWADLGELDCAEVDWLSRGARIRCRLNRVSPTRISYEYGPCLLRLTVGAESGKVLFMLNCCQMRCCPCACCACCMAHLSGDRRFGT